MNHAIDATSNHARHLTGDRLRALVVTAPGINCDRELGEAFAAAGAEPEFVLLDVLRREPSRIDAFDLIGLPGGFSFGDDVAAGRVMAALMRREVYPAMRAAIERGTPIICPCNGFQIAVQAGLLPGPVSTVHGGAWPDTPARPSMALSQNQSARFHDGWTRVEIPANTRCLWTAGLECTGDDALLPSAHGEGRFVTSEAELVRLESNGQVAIRYAAEANFNGSMGAVAGICDPSGLVFGLMPHPERYLHWTQHPWWTRMDRSWRATHEPLGLRMFRAAVAHVHRTQSGASSRSRSSMPRR
ncbi:MAG: phosphoribosylformylglycinamidine synthase subunit PurQ [Planctomycetota bacterium]|nr:phosphoribosylformylglycinamidine synthase subunit PurQ [Planctomycetota bacterium]MDA1106674.1 phosphoribosylformylglycinamidine synthase subunit PurQ [Planctomycetota bacterium]